MLGLDVGTAIAHLKELNFVGVNEAYIESKYLLLEVFGVLDDIRPTTLQNQFAEDCKDFLAIQKCHDRGDCSEAMLLKHLSHMSGSEKSAVYTILGKMSWQGTLELSRSSCTTARFASKARLVGLGCLLPVAS